MSHKAPPVTAHRSSPPSGTRDAGVCIKSPSRNTAVTSSPFGSHALTARVSAPQSAMTSFRCDSTVTLPSQGGTRYTYELVSESSTLHWPSSGSPPSMRPHHIRCRHRAALRTEPFPGRRRQEVWQVPVEGEEKPYGETECRFGATTPKNATRNRLMIDPHLVQEGDSWSTGDWVYARLGAREVERLNQEVIKVHQDVSDEVGINRMEPPPISQQIFVFNVARRECYLVLIHQLNCGSAVPPRVGNLVKLSHGRFAPHHAPELRLATPAYYRKREHPDSTPTDQHDGYLTKDATPWARDLALRTAGSIIHDLRASVTFSSSPDEPWIYCTSIAPASNAETERLRARFPRYDAITSIMDADAFAMQLGIDFAITVDKFPAC